MAFLVPTVIDGDSRGAFDIYSLLLKERIVFLGTAIDDQVANLMVAQLLILTVKITGPLICTLTAPAA